MRYKYTSTVLFYFVSDTPKSDAKESQALQL